MNPDREQHITFLSFCLVSNSVAHSLKVSVNSHLTVFPWSHPLHLALTIVLSPFLHRLLSLERRNLELNGVADRCQIHFGDNRKLKLSNTADRVNLGLIPSSEEGWPIACQVLRKDVGGILHIHQNVDSFSGTNPQPPGSSNAETEHGPHPQKSVTDAQGNGTTGDFRGEMLPSASKPEWQRWAESAETQIASLLRQVHGKPWRTRILHVHPVKSYAPHVDHIVLDLDCRPCPQVD